RRGDGAGLRRALVRQLARVLLLRSEGAIRRHVRHPGEPAGNVRASSHPSRGALRARALRRDAERTVRGAMTMRLAAIACGGLALGALRVGLTAPPAPPLRARAAPHR